MANDFKGPGDFDGSSIDVAGSPANDKIEKTTAWIAPDENAPPGCGRIMLTRADDAAGQPDPVAVVPFGFSFLKKIFGILAPDSPNVAGNIAIKSNSAANDNIVWVGDEANDGGGVYGSDVDAATLADGSSVVAWIGPDRVVHAKYYPADGDGLCSAEEATAGAEHAGQINALLADLGGAGQRAGNADGRVKITAYGQGGIAALWVADFGFTAALMGKLYMLQQDPVGDGASDTPGAQLSLWTVSDIPPVAVPRLASYISIDVSDDGQMSVRYQSEPGDGGSEFAVSVESGAASEDELRGSDEGDFLAPEAEALDLQVPHGSSAPLNAGKTDTSQVSQSDADAAASDGDGNAPAGQGQALDPALDQDSNGGSLGPTLPDVTADVEIIGTPITIAGGEGDNIAQKKPQVVAQGDKIAVLHVSDGEKPGTSVIQVDLIDENGNPVLGFNGAPASVVVASDAIVEVTDKPFLDLEPSISFAGEMVVVGYVSNSGDAEHTQYQLNLQLVDEDGSLACDAPTVVALAFDPQTTYSDFDTAGIFTHQNDDDGHRSESNDVAQDASEEGLGSTVQDSVDSAPPVAQVAIVWVENANASGYGSIMGQRFGILENHSSGESGDNSGPGNSGNGEGGLVLVALGRDGDIDGDGGNGDQAFGMPFETAEDVIGRAPQVCGCGDNGIVVAWVQESSAGSGVEVIAGAVLQASTGNSLLAINLTGLITHGILNGTEPSLLSDQNGDIVIGWVQGGNGGHYEAAVAIYRALSTGGWTVPDAAHVLRTFESEPRNLDFGLQGGDDPTILLSWSGDSGRVSGAYFDLDGNQEGSVFRIGGDDGSFGGGDVSVAGLSDDHIIVVYTQADGADTDIGAMIVRIAPSAAGDNIADGGSSGSDSGSLGSGSSEQSPDSGSSQIAIIVTTPSEPDASSASDVTSGAASDVTSDSGTTMSLVVVDLESDLIRVYDSAQFQISGSTSSTSASSSNSGSGSSNSGSGSGGGDSGTPDYSGDDAHIDAHDDNDAYVDLDGHSGGDSSGSASPGSGSGGDYGSDKEGDYDNLAFSVGYGNEVDNYYEDEHVFDVAEPVADMFDALQFANALSDNGNGEVIVFEASNLVVIRDFETL